MSATVKRAIALIAAIGALAAGLFLAVGAASAAPYPPAPTTTAPTTAASTSGSASVSASNTSSGATTSTSTAGSTSASTGSSSAAPTDDAAPATLSVTDSTPPEGSAEGVTGNHYGAFEVVQLEFHSVVASLGTVTTDSKGSFSTTVQLPAGATGSHEIVGTGLTTGDVASASLQIGGSGAGGAGGSNGSGGGSGSGGLSSTGVAVIGIGALGVVLLAGGGMLLLAGKRRRPTAI